MKALSIVDTEDHISEEAVENSAAKIISSGSVIFVTRSGILAHSFPVATTKSELTVNQDLKAVTPEPVIDTQYLAWCLRAHARLILDNCTKDGTTVQSIEVPSLKLYKVPIAPLNEQRRIVAKIEQLFSELDKGVESLKTAREQLNVYRQAVLKHAFEGKLTAQWREEHKDELVSADELFARIKAEREARYQQMLAEWKAACKKWESQGQGGRKPLKPRAPKPLSKLAGDVRADLPAIPHTWVWEKLGWMTCGVEYGTAARSAETGSVPVIRMGNLQNGTIDWQDLAFTSDKIEIEKYSLAPGDVLFNRTNSPELVGKAAIYRGERPALFAGYLIRINHIETLVSSQYLNLFLGSHVARRHGSTVKTDGVNQSNINGEKLQSYPFPYCSLAEQCEVVRMLDEKLSLTDRLMQEIDAGLAKSAALRQSILQQAFSGQLVAQDLNDEPASVLLERIKAEKAEQNKDNKNNKRRDAA
jgi:type I restriction enzyme S subunit